MSDEARIDLKHPRYPRSDNYDPKWIIDNHMGPHPLWLLESLCEAMDIRPGMKVLDLGCGKALTSVFLAREFGARVWAADLWIDAKDNRRRLEEAGVASLVAAVDAEAHALPFEEGLFDAVVSIDAYQYFGTDELYLGYITKFLRPGGQIGIVVPSFSRDPKDVPPSLAPWWHWEFWAFHSPEWWRRHWAKTGLVTVEHAEWIEDCWRDWLRFGQACLPFIDGWMKDATIQSDEMLRADAGELLGFARVLATKPPD